VRTTLKELPDAIHKWGLKDAVGGWWIDLPRRWRLRWWWKSLFLEPGQGLLRWGYDKREEWRGWDTPPEPFTVAPPFRRLWLVLRFHAKWPLEMTDPDWLK
jgi:hypothetical protein